MFTRCILGISRTGQWSAWEPVPIVSASVNLQCVRWRKRRTDPPAKNKVIIKRRPVPNEWEDSFLKTRNNHYKTLMKGVRPIIVKQVEEAAATDELLLVRQKSVEEYPAILEWNEQENQKTRAERERRLAEAARKAEEEKLVKLLKDEEKRAGHLEHIEELVRKEKEASKSFITLENMEEKIEETIKNPKNYNFTLDRDGVVHLPEDTAWKELQEKQEQERKQSLAES